MKHLLLALVAAFGCCVATHAQAEPLLVATDLSLSVTQYEARGVPSVGHAWSDAEMAHAVGVLQKLAAEDPLKLPRLESHASGAVFARMVAAVGLPSDNTSTENLKARIAELSGYAKPQGALALLYAKPLAGDFFFDAELVESTRAALEVNLRMLTLINRERGLLQGKAAPPWLVREHQQVAYGAELTVRGALFIYSARRAFRQVWRDKLGADLRKWVPALMAQLPEASHTAIMTHLHGLMLEDPKGFADWQPVQDVMTFVGHGPPGFAKGHTHRGRHRKNK